MMLRRSRTGGRPAGGARRLPLRQTARNQPGFSTLRLFVSLQGLLSQPLRGDDRGATAVEYGLMVALIAAAIVVAVTALGGQLNTLFTNVSNGI